MKKVKDVSTSSLVIKFFIVFILSISAFTSQSQPSLSKQETTSESSYEEEDDYCPECKKMGSVIDTKYGMVVHYKFDDKRQEKNYFKKIKKQGYRTHYDYISRKEYVIWVADIPEMRKLRNISNKHFCKDCKRVFK